ncbi:NAD-dependent epimerase/dehydratase family protein, partial [Helicobacter labetoulli]
MNILLTGATGFIGTNFVLQLHKKYKIIALVRTSSDTSKIEAYCRIYRFTNVDSILDLFENRQFDGVVHLATSFFLNHAIQDTKELIDSNIYFGINLLEACKLHSIPFFINTSTFGSYYNSLSYRPASLYAATKKAFEDMMLYYSLTSQTLFTNLLIYNVYGPNDTATKLFALLGTIAQSDEVIQMSDGSQIVDYSHVFDIVDGFDCLIELIQKDPEFCKDKIFSLKGKERQTLKEVVMLYEKVLGKKLNIKWGARPLRELEIMTPWEGGETLPNWEQKITLREGFKMMVTAKNI